MTITGSTDLGDGRLFLTVDHDPEITNTDGPAGSLILATNGIIFRKLAAGPTTNVLALTASSQAFNWNVGPDPVNEIITDGLRSFEMPDGETTKIIGSDSIPISLDLNQDVFLDSHLVITTTGTANGDIVLRLSIRYLTSGDLASDPADEVLTKTISITNTDKLVLSFSYQLDNTIISSDDTLSMELERLGTDINDTFDGSVGIISRSLLRFLR